MYCISCGIKLCDEANYCHNCGKMIDIRYKALQPRTSEAAQPAVPDEVKYIDDYVNSLFQDDEHVTK